jgi:hypothetical protein
MKSYLFIIALFICNKDFSQPSDFIVLKKGQQSIKSFFAGSNITVETVEGSYSGQVTSIKKDSLFINQYDIRQLPTNLGVYVVDTVATYRLAFNYKDITRIEDQRHKGFDWSASGGSLLGGGILITVVGLGTWIFAKPGTPYHASPVLVGAGAALAGIGYLLLRSHSNKYKIGKKYQVEYVKVK